jgi:hypothetical protein
MGGAAVARAMTLAATIVSHVLLGPSSTPLPSAWPAYSSDRRSR